MSLEYCKGTRRHSFLINATVLHIIVTVIWETLGTNRTQATLTTFNSTELNRAGWTIAVTARTNTILRLPFIFRAQLWALVAAHFLHHAEGTMHLHLGYPSVLFLTPDCPNTKVWLPGKKALAFHFQASLFHHILVNFRALWKKNKKYWECSLRLLNVKILVAIT